MVRWGLGPLGWIFGQTEGWSEGAGDVWGLTEGVVGAEDPTPPLVVDGRRAASRRAAFVQSRFPRVRRVISRN